MAAVEQLNATGDILPRICILKDGKIYEVSTLGMKFETALDILESQMTPDVVNLTAMAWSHLRLSENDTETSTPKRRLFAMAFDRFGSRWVSLYEIHKERNEIKTKDIDLGYSGPSNLSLHTTDNGELEVRFELGMPRA